MFISPRCTPDLHHSSNGRGGWTGYFLNFTSQTWLTPELVQTLPAHPPRAQVSISEWWHIMVVIVPDTLTTTDTTLLWLGSGGNTDDLPDFSDIGNDYELLIAGGLATANNIVTSIVFQVPHHFLPPPCV